MPHVATSPADLLAALRGAAHLDGDRIVIDDEAAFRERRDPRPRLDGGVQHGRGHDGRGAVAGSGRPARRSAHGRRASRDSTQRAPAARCPGSPSRPSISGPRLSTWPGQCYETAAAADVGAVILELARSEQTYTFQRPVDYATSVLAGAVAAGWRGPVFIQGDHYQFNAKKYAAKTEAMTEEIQARLPPRRGCRLSQHRHQFVDARGLLAARHRRGAARELHPRRGAHRPDPDARGGRRDHQRRRRDRRGGDAEFDGRGAARLPGRLPARAGRSGSWRARDQQGQRADRDLARGRAAPRRRRRGRQAGLRGPA